MWLEQEKFREIDHAVVKGERRGLSRLLFELFHPENQKFPKNPTLCPKCNKTLVRKMHPYLEYFVQACPDRHGAWISPEVSLKLRQFVSEQMLIATKRKQALQFLLALFLGLLCFSLLAQSPRWISNWLPNYEDLKVGEKYWPQREFRNFPSLPLKESSIDNAEEIFYVSQVLELLEDAASNRMNMDTVLKTRRSGERYWKAFEIYQQKQYEFLGKLRVMTVPEPLKEFHGHIETAAEAQLEFYGAFVHEKAQNASIGLQDMLGHPALKICNQSLLSAFDFIQKHYPNLDMTTRQAVESRLCWFDVI
jgi:hypothetical protein